MGLFDSIKKFVDNIFGAIGDVLGYVLGIDPDAADQYKGQLINKSSNIQKIPVIYGERLVGGTRVFVSTGGGKSNQYLYIALVLSEGEVEEIGDIYINDVLSTDPKFGISSEFPSGGFSGLLERMFGNKVTIEKYTGTDDQAPTTLFDEANDNWTSAHQLKGVAYLAMRFKYDQDLFSSIPEIRAVVKGKKVYDPRTQTTGWSDNPALCLRDYLTNSRYGKGLPVAAIDDASIIQAANDCDSLVTPFSGSGSISLFKYDAIVDTGETIFDNVKKILASMRGILPYSNGQYSLLVDKDQSSTFTLTEDNILSDIKIVSSSKENKFNQVTAKFPNPAKRWELDTVTYPDSGSTEETQFLTEDNQQILSKEITLHNVTNAYRAKDLARIACLASRRQSLTVSVTCTSEALNIAVGDIVTIEHDSLGWTGEAVQEFRVMGMVLDDSGEVDLTLQQYDSSIYPWVEQSEAADNPETTLPDPFFTAPVTNPTSTGQAVIQDDGTVVYFYDLEWDEPDDALVEYYLIDVNKTVGGVETVAAETLQTQNLSFRYMVSDTSIDYGFTIKAVNGAGTRSEPIEITAVEVVTDTTPPGQPTDTSVQGTFKQIILEWTNPTDNDFSYIEIKRSADNNELNAAYISQISGEKYIDGQFEGVVTYYYWIRSVDTSGNASEWLSCGGGTSLQLVTNDFADGVITQDFLDVSTQNIINNAVLVSTFNDEISDLNDAIDLKAPQSQVDSIINDTQRIDDTLDLASEKLLQMALFSGEQVGIMRDAGITVDPDNGSVTIQAVETLRSETEAQFTQVGIDVDAVEGQLSLYATRTFVEGEIAAAQLDPTEFTAFTDLEARVTEAEIDINANDASIQLKASQVELDNLEGRVTTAESDIDINAGQIALKASQSSFDTLETRVNTAEVQINALDIPSISQTVTATRDIYNRLNRDDVQTLQDLLNTYNEREAVKRDLSFVRTEISANLTENREAIATARTELASAIDDNLATIITEQQTRASEDSALASQINALTVTVGENSSSIISEQQARADADGVIASDVLQLEGRVEDNEADIVQINTIEVTSDSAIARSVAQLNVDVGDAEADIVQINTVSAESDSAIARTVHGLNADITDPTTGLQANADAIDGIDTVVNDSETGLSAQADRITSLSATVGEEAVFEQDAAPETANEGDLWRKTIEGVYLGELYQYNGTTWETKSTNFANANDSLTVKAIGESASQAVAISTLTSTTGTNTADISTLTSTQNGVKAQHAVTINNNGFISGFGLISELIDDEVTSSFSVQADSFSLASATSSGIWDSEESYLIIDVVTYLGKEYKAKTNNSNKVPDANASDWEDITTIPFVVYTSNTNVTKNGEVVTIPKGVYIQDAFIQTASINTANIQNAAITNAKINDLDASKITAGFISADRIESGSIDAKIANIGWAKIEDVSITNADINDLSAEKINAGTLSSDRLSVDGATIDTDGTGQLIIKDLGVSTIKIANQAVTIPSNAFTAADILIGTAETTLQQVTFTSTGAPVNITFSAKVRSLNIGFGNSATNTLYVYRGTTLLFTYEDVVDMDYNQTATVGFSVKDDPAAGNVTYYIKSKSSSNNGHRYSLRSLSTLEVKK